VKNGIQSPQTVFKFLINIQIFICSPAPVLSKWHTLKFRKNTSTSKIHTPQV